MNKSQLYLIAKLTRSNTSSKAFQAAEDVLLNGLSQNEVKTKYGISKSTVSDAVKRFTDYYNEVCTVFKVKK
ncbi:transcriptional regulator KorA [Vibrio fluvialis]|nr:transcriptional regulator KorA [Vibrio fluvialis]